MSLRSVSPSSGSPDRDTLVAAIPEFAEIGSEGLRGVTVSIWAEAWRTSAWKDLHDCPTSVAVQERSLIDHTRTVTRSTIALLQTGAAGFALDRDAAVAIALLHDVSKLHELEPADDGARTSEIGLSYTHGFLATHWAIKHGLPTLVTSGIATHTTMSAAAPRSPEALVVHYADFLDADLFLQHAGLELLSHRT